MCNIRKIYFNFFQINYNFLILKYFFSVLKNLPKEIIIFKFAIKNIKYIWNAFFVEGTLFFFCSRENTIRRRSRSRGRWRILDAIHIRRRATDKGFRCGESEGSDSLEVRRKSREEEGESDR